MKTDYSVDKVPFWPIFLTMTLMNLSSSIETILDETIIGHLLNEEAFGAVNLLEPYTSFGFLCSELLCMGGLALMVRALGEGDKERASHLFGHCVTVVSIFSLVYFLIYLLFGKQLVYVVANDSAVYSYALDALRGQTGLVLVNGIDSLLCIYVMYMGGAALCVFSNVVYLLSNVVLSQVLGSKLGIFGVTFASFLATVIDILIILLFFVKKEHRIPFRLHIDFSLFKEIASLKMGESALLVSFVLVEFVFNRIALKNFGVVGLGAIAITIDLYYFVLIMSAGISEFETVSLNAYMGQKSEKRISRSMKIVFLAGVLEALFFCVLIIAAAPHLAEWMGNDDPELLRTTKECAYAFSLLPVTGMFIRIVSVFYQYTGRVMRALYGFVFGLGLFPCAMALMFGSFSPVILSLCFTIGSLSAIILWLVYMKFIKKEKLIDPHSALESH